MFIFRKSTAMSGFYHATLWYAMVLCQTQEYLVRPFLRLSVCLSQAGVLLK